MAVGLETPLTSVVDAFAATQLRKHRRLETVGDLLWFLPRRYLDRHADLGALLPGAPVVFAGQVRSAQRRSMRRRRGELLTVVVGSGDHEIDLTFFKPYGHDKKLVPGRWGIFAGQVSTYGGRWQLTHPAYEILGEDSGDDSGGGSGQDSSEDSKDSARVGVEMPAAASTVYPVYLDVPKLPSFTITRLVSSVLLRLGPTPGPVPEDIRAARRLPDFAEAMRLVHAPADQAEAYRGRHALKYEEAFVLQAVLARRRAQQHDAVAIPRTPAADGILAAFDAQLPFSLTDGQRAVSDEIFADLARGHPMNRLLQGEVGSGKTVVALRAMLAAVDAGGQAALLAPTEVLAAQHHRSITAMLGALAEGGLLGGAENGTRVALLTGSQPAAARKVALLEAASGQAGIVVGTHALLQEKVSFADLALVVVDEQHRFGVEQRDALRVKARDDRTPHVLVMTATPIPRTVAMTVFGDMDTSTLAQLPSGRSPITSHVVDNPRWYERAWERVAEEVAAGHQAYVVCPRIGDAPPGSDMADDELRDPDAEAEEDEEEFGDGAGIAGGMDGAGGELGGRSDAGRADPARPARGVLETLEELRAHPALAGLRIEMVHGRLAPEDKDATMRAFAAGAIDVLVSTTVIEVGVDVPNATVMVVLDADRFGVSQLHQLRGRVGRGSAPGLALFATTSEVPSARERLAAVAETLDGFALSQLDLEQRREGDVLGALQSGGRSSLRVLRVRTDETVIAQAREDAQTVMRADPHLSSHPELARAVEELLAHDEARFLERG